MKVRIKANGQIMHVNRDHTAQIMMAAGLIEELPNVTEVIHGDAKWSIFEEMSTGNVAIHGVCSVCRQDCNFMPAATHDAIARCKFWHCTKGETIPHDVAQQYIDRGGVPFGYPGQNAPQPEPPEGEFARALR